MVVTPQGSAMQKIIDPHLHFFDLNKGSYTWLKPNNPPFWPDKNLINKDIMPSDLIIDSDELELIGGVHIEAGFDNAKSQNELCWLEQEVYPFEAKYVFKSISYIDLKMPNVDFINQLNMMLKFQTFTGIRYTIEDNCEIFDDSNNLIENIKFLENAGILLEVQLSFCDDLQASCLRTLMLEAPSLKLIINHSGLPPSGLNQSKKDRLDLSNEFDKALTNDCRTWEKSVAQFAELPNCFIKCSGFEMQNRQYTKQDVIEIISRIHGHFGNNRMMLASNFPLTLLTTSYSEYWKLLYECAKEAQLDCERLMHRNTKDLYRF